MPLADASSDAYDRGFALSLLSQGAECSVRNRRDAQTRRCRTLRRLFARFTVECQTQIEKQKKAMRVQLPVKSLLGLTDEEGGEGEEEDTITDSHD